MGIMAWPMDNALSKAGWTGKPLIGVTPPLMDVGREARLWRADDGRRMMKAENG